MDPFQSSQNLLGLVLKNNTKAALVRQAPKERLCPNLRMLEWITRSFEIF